MMFSYPSAKDRATTLHNCGNLTRSDVFSSVIVFCEAQTFPFMRQMSCFATLEMHESVTPVLPNSLMTAESKMEKSCIKAHAVLKAFNYCKANPLSQNTANPSIYMTELIRNSTGC